MFFRKYSLYFAWVISLLGTMGSLYFSEIKQAEPCVLCWYQRISLFPMALILGIATYRGFRGIIPYVIPLAIFGLLIAFYQIAIQEIPGFDPIKICGKGPSCEEKTYIGLGPITIPMLSAAAFTVLTFILTFSYFKERNRSHL